MNDLRDVLDLFDEQKDFVNEKVEYGIEKYRKGDGRIRIVDKDGAPIPGAKISLDQKTHEFRFGANLFMLDELETEEKNEKYKAYFADVFNMATLPFYWDALEPRKGETRYTKDSPKIYRRPNIDLCIEYCDKHGIEPREHALAYDQFFPEWLCGASVEETKRELERRYAEISERYADKIRTIEVTNEMEWEKGITAFYDAPDFVEWCFKTAEKYFPNNQLVINEHTSAAWQDRCRVTDKYYSYIEANMLKGARIDAIGFQYHLFKKREELYEKTRITLNPELLYKHMDMYSDLGKPLQVTEVTIPAYSWEAEDEAAQAEIIKNLYSVWFSHPNVEQIIYWNLVDGYAAFAPLGDMTAGENYYYGGLIRFDMTPKPSYFVLKDLINNEWHTEATLVTNDNGIANFRGFYGNYEIKVTVGEKTYTKEIKLSKNLQNTFEISL